MDSCVLGPTRSKFPVIPPLSSPSFGAVDVGEKIAHGSNEHVVSDGTDSEAVVKSDIGVKIVLPSVCDTKCPKCNGELRACPHPVTDIVYLYLTE